MVYFFFLILLFYLYTLGFDIIYLTRSCLCCFSLWFFWRLIAFYKKIMNFRVSLVIVAIIINVQNLQTCGQWRKVWLFGRNFFFYFDNYIKSIFKPVKFWNKNTYQPIKVSTIFFIYIINYIIKYPLLSYLRVLKQVNLYMRLWLSYKTFRLVYFYNDIYILCKFEFSILLSSSLTNFLTEARINVL